MGARKNFEIFENFSGQVLKNRFICAIMNRIGDFDKKGRRIVMTEIIPSVWVSPNSRIEKNVMLGKNVIIYGNTTISKNTIIEDNVIIGHPSPSEVKNLYSSFDETWGNDLSVAYDSVSVKSTYIGEKCIIRSNTTIYNGNYIGDNFDCGHNVIIREDCNISNDCYFFTHTQVKRSSVFGQNCRIAGTVCDRTKVGDYTTMLGHTVHKNTSGVGGKIEIAPTIGVGTIVGREAVIVGAVTIGDFSVIATNTVVLNDIESFVVVGGIPAKHIRTRSLEEISDITEKMKGDNYEHKAFKVENFQ
jgi:UDP-3-O-[3-hydroxymyristoyl] glucosamine N-acyltransferase